MTEFMCFRCNYKTKYRGSIKNHFNKKKKCERNINSLKYTDNEIFKLSFLPLNESINIHFINDNSINKNKIKKTKNQILEEIKNIHNNKNKYCVFCNKLFEKSRDIKNHILSYCDAIQIVENNDSEISNILINNKYEAINNITNNNIQNHLINNSTNTTNTTNTTNISANNIININLVSSDGEKQAILSFDEKWDVSHLNDEIKLKLFLSTVKYTKTLEYILKNNMNRNVVIEKNTESGFVYNNEKIEIMKVSDIIEQSITKIYNHLKDFSNEIIKDDNFELNKAILDGESDNTEKKYKDFCEDDNVKKNVEIFFSDIYNKNICKTKENFINILDQNQIKEYGF